MDPGLRPQILDYNPNIRDQVRRAYLQKGPCQPKWHKFPFKKFGEESRRFNACWFNGFSTWLEYSIEKDAAFCLACYLFKPDNGEQGGGESFVGKGFSNWKKKDRLKTHVGIVNSVHNQAWSKCEASMKQPQHISTLMSKWDDQDKNDYRIRLTASVECVRFLLPQGLAFRGVDESEDSRNRGNFLELLKFHCIGNEDVRAVTLKIAPGNNKLTSSDIQKDIVHAIAAETSNALIKEMCGKLFSILIDESCDVSGKEKMVVILRYVNNNGEVIERFLCIEHVTSTTALALKAAVDQIFSRHGLSIGSLRGQGYDGASNMKGELNGLKTLIMRENESAYYVHCFAHQLQLALVAVAKKHIPIHDFFDAVGFVVNIVNASAKRRDILWDKEAMRVYKALSVDEIPSGKGLNQETALQRCGETRWGSHYGSLMSITSLFPTVLDVLETIVDDGYSDKQKIEASRLMKWMQSFDFVFSLHLMKGVLTLTNDLSQALQRKDQDIVNAMKLVGICKQQLQKMRDD